MEAALAGVDIPALILAVDSDRLYPVSNAVLLDEHLEGSNGVKVVHSDVGHDGFLVESEQVNGHVVAFLDGLP